MTNLNLYVKSRSCFSACISFYNQHTLRPSCCIKGYSSTFFLSWPQHFHPFPWSGIGTPLTWGSNPWSRKLTEGLNECQCRELYLLVGTWHSISWTKIARHAFTLFVNTIKIQGNDSEIPTCLVYKFSSLPLHHMNTLDHILREICMASHKSHERIRKRQEIFPPPTSLPAFTVKECIRSTHGLFRKASISQEGKLHLLNTIATNSRLELQRYSLKSKTQFWN